MDLHAPLGMRPPPPSRRRFVLLAVVIAGAAALGGVVVSLTYADPRGGHPFMVAAIPPVIRSAPVKFVPLDPTPTGAIPPPVSRQEAASANPGSLEGGVMVYRGGVGGPAAAAGGGPLVIDVSRALDDPLGKSHGAMVARPGPKAIAQSAPRTPRVAIFVSGMGLDAGATRTAIETMPAAVTLAFLPYGETLVASVAAAKGKGHEVLLQVPMRNDGGSVPGAHALRADAPVDTTKSDLAWTMGRFAGYDGLVNLLGAPVTADPAVMTAVLKAAGARHLFYLDDGTSRRSVATDLAADLNVTAIKADVVLDATADPALVRANLDRLVAIAKRSGRAIGMASGLPEHLGTIARFAAELDGKGVTLVPVADLAQGDAPSGMAATR